MAKQAQIKDEEEFAQQVELVHEILVGRAAGNFDTCAGNADEDLLAALEEVRNAIPGMLRWLEGRRSS